MANDIAMLIGNLETHRCCPITSQTLLGRLHINQISGEVIELDKSKRVGRSTMGAQRWTLNDGGAGEYNDRRRWAYVEADESIEGGD